MDLNKLKEKKWHVEHFDGCPFYVSMPAYGFTANSKYGLTPYSSLVLYSRNEQSEWCTLEDDIKIIGRQLVESFIKKKAAVIKNYDTWLKNFKEILLVSRKLLDADFGHLSDDALIKLFENYYHQSTRKLTFPGFIDAYMFYADFYFNDLIAGYCEKNGIKNPVKIFAVLAAPVDKSFIMEREEGINNLATAVKSRKYENDKSIESKISAHLNKFYWFNCNYAGFRPYSRLQIIKEIQDIINNKESVNIKSQQHLVNQRLKRQLLKKFKFTNRIKAIVTLTELIIHWQDLRKISSLNNVAVSHKFLKEISQRTQIDLKLLAYANPGEFKRLLQKKLTAGRLKARRKSCLIFYKNGVLNRIVTGKPADNFIKAIKRQITGDSTAIKGLAASLGKVRGQVKIITACQDLGKLRPGDILVTSMTRPEHVTGMKRAAAIVTDDGGLTCHAAIVSRELGIPCVIGTKIATQVLRDGDLVEVDANNGLVKKL